MCGGNVLILGAGLMQKPAILASKKLGYNTVVIDADPAAQCIPLADRFEQIDLKDREQILNFASEMKQQSGLEAIFTAGTDFSASVSYAGEKLGLCCHSFKAALNASVKPQMRACFAAAGLPSPAYFSIKKEDIKPDYTVQLAEQLGFPCVVKPADNMGARGCRMIRKSPEVYGAVQNAAANSRTSTAILEQYMEGPEYSIDALVFNGSMTITGFADRHIYYPPYFIETGHTMPAEIDEKKRLELISVFALGVKALGLTCGAAKADIKYTASGPMIGEIAARLSGGYMSGWTYPYASGCNLTEQALMIACGREPEYLLKNRLPLEFTPPPSCSGVSRPFEIFDLPCPQVSAERAWISIPGRIRNISGLDAAPKIPFVQDVLPRSVCAGENIDFPRNNVQKCGNIITFAANREDAVSYAEKAASCIFLRLEGRNQETEEFLSGKTKAGEDMFPPPAYSLLPAVEKLNLTGMIPENVPVLQTAGSELLKLLDSKEKNWNYMTAHQTAALFDVICSRHPALDKKRFWHALFRGGIQAAVYVSDSSAENK